MARRRLGTLIVIARPWTYETDPRGTLGLLVDPHRRVLGGAWGDHSLQWAGLHAAIMLALGVVGF